MTPLQIRVWDNQDKKVYYCRPGKSSHISLYYSNPVRYKTMLYTGLQDRNNSPIYEGDIVVVPPSNRVMLIIYQAPSFVMKEHNSSQRWKAFLSDNVAKQLLEVVGNVYEMCQRRVSDQSRLSLCRSVIG